ncbi:MAG: ferrous iron transport protein B [Magnetococcales bacterium]|nr:ferrous iron transport protein B [Magnetococcales bacterium]
MTSEPTVTVGLIGNPNSGKTTIFNRLCRSNDPVGNYPRVTVSVRERTFDYEGVTFRLADLPGLYALTTQTPEESGARDYIHDERASIWVNVLDSGNLERALYLTTQLVEMGRRMVFVLNMIDEAERKQWSIDAEALSRHLGGPVIKVNGVTGQGLDRLRATLLEMSRSEQTPEPVVIDYDDHLVAAVERVSAQIRQFHPDRMTPHQVRWLAIKLLEGDDALLRREGDHASLLEMIQQERDALAAEHGGECEMLFADARYAHVHTLITTVVDRSGVVGEPLPDRTARLDGLLLHPLLGMPLFFVFLWLMFQTTFTLGEYPMGWIEAGVGWVKEMVGGWLPTGMVHDLVVEGVIAGVGGTIVFLPNIVILFFFMAMFSETGYLTRASFLMDRLMHTFGLHGKALIPLVIGFGCNVPAVMATRTIETPRARLIAILVNPFMLCAARLPVFILFAGAFFSEHAASMVFLMYLISMAMALIGSLLLNRLLPRGAPESFIMELPPYRMPTLKALTWHMWDNALNFLNKIAGVILIGSIVLWFLKEFPKEIVWSQDYAGQIERLQATPETPARQEAITQLTRQRDQEALSNSHLGRIARAAAPMFAPLELTWRDTVAILTGLMAKEVVVASYAVLYSEEREKAEESASLKKMLSSSMPPRVAFAFMVFTLLYSPCLATVAAIRREAGGWHWAGFSVVFSLGIAWSLAFGIVTVGRWLS